MARKGQAAVEFLMTYGWAILAAVIAIGVLAYFGVFSPGKYVTGSAIVNAPFYVNAWNVQSSPGALGGVNLELRNNGGEDYYVYGVTVTGCGPEDLTTHPNYNVANGNVPALAGSITPFQILCTTPTTRLVLGSTLKGDITIGYRKLGSAIDLTSTGTIAEKITA